MNATAMLIMDVVIALVGIYLIYVALQKNMR